MRSAAPWMSFVFVAAASACGPNNGAGFTVSGTLTASVTGGGPTQASGFRFMGPNGGGVRVDPMLPPGTLTGVTGTCSVGPTGRTITLTRVGDDGTLGLRSIAIAMPDWSQDNCTNCQHGQINVQLATGTFAGTEVRGGAASSCTFTATQSGSFGMDLTVQCAALASPGDTRTLEVSGTLSLQNCDGPETRNTR